MRLVLKKDDNTEVEVKEIQTINKDCKAIIFFVKARIHPEDLKVIERKMSNKLGKSVVILPGYFETKIYSLL